tara:strand:- start:404 stop:781 length:378 start_codon:yes stop_codon:yes gene_type:complete
MLNQIFNRRILAVLILIISISAISCTKKEDTIGMIIVKRNGNLVQGADVTLFPNNTPSPTSGEYPDATLIKTKKTDANGQAEFIYELEAVLNVSVTKIDGNASFSGTNVIQLEAEKTVTKIIEIN